jgi:molybdate transport system substrate-binding protein
MLRMGVAPPSGDCYAGGGIGISEQRNGACAIHAREEDIMALSKVIAAAGLLSMVIAAPAAQAAEIVVLSTTAAQDALKDLVPLFERASGHKINITYGPGPRVADRIRAGATGDLFIGPQEYNEPLLKEGKLVAGSGVDFAHSLMGVAIRAGAPKPDISTADKFKSAMLAAKSVSWSAGASGMQIVDIFKRLGINDAIEAKRVNPQGDEPVGAVVARGSAEVGIHQISQLLPVGGIEIAGPVPRDLQKVIIYAATALPGSKQPDAAKAFVTFLRSPPAAEIIKKKGMDPV